MQVRDPSRMTFNQGAIVKVCVANEGIKIKAHVGAPQRN
jgi:hypothetical protein